MQKLILVMSHETAYVGATYENRAVKVSSRPCGEYTVLPLLKNTNSQKCDYDRTE